MFGMSCSMRAFLLLAAQAAAQPAQVVIRPGGMVQIVNGGLLQVGDDSGSGGSDPWGCHRPDLRLASAARAREASAHRPWPVTNP